MTIAVIIFIHVLVCIALIMIVLLQTGKGADMGAAFGGGGSQTLFGSSGASTFLGKATAGAAIIFMITSLALAYISTHQHGSGSVMTDVKPAVTTTETTTQAESQPEEKNAPAAKTPAPEKTE